MRRYLELFLEESREHLRSAGQAREALERNPADREPWRELQRHAHSLKGMAASLGFREMVEVAHALEDRLQDLRETGAPDVERESARLRESFAALEQMVENIERGEVRPSEIDPRRQWRMDLRLRAEDTARDTVSVIARVASLGRVVQANPPMLEPGTGRFEGKLGLILETDQTEDELRQALAGVPGVPEFSLLPDEAPDPRSASADEPPHWVRVTAEQLDTLHEELSALRLEHRRLRSRLAARSRRIRRHLEQTSMRLRSMQATVMELRLVPFESVRQRLERTVHDLAEELGKEVEFAVEGGQLRLDRTVLESLVAPLLHVVRNALDHGLEAPAERRSNGKPSRGRLHVGLERRGDRVHLTVADDGRGMLPGRVKERALELGLVDAAEAERLSPKEALLLTTLPGFSTAPRVSHVSGRGVGLDVVRDGLAQLGGRLDLHSTEGSGTEVRMSVPFSVAAIPTLLLRCADETYAVPIEAVRWTATLPEERADGNGRMKTAFGPVAVLRLDHHLGLRPSDHPVQGGSWTVLLSAAERRVVLVVDDLAGREDILVKPLRAPLTPLCDYQGAALLADGTIALVLDPARLVATSPPAR